MHKFKVGDKVKRLGSSFRNAIKGCEYEVTQVVGGGIRIKGDDKSMYDDRNFLVVKREETALLSTPSWDYAEAQRLQNAAKTAVKAYNEYVDRKPETIFLKMPDY